MFVELEDGTYVSKDLVGSISVFKTGSDKNHRLIARICDKRGQHLGNIDITRSYSDQFWISPEATVIPAQPGYTCINAETGAGIDDEVVIHYAGPVIAWKIYPNESDMLQPVPIGMFGDEDGAIAPDGKVVFRDTFYNSIDDLKSTLGGGL